MASQEEKLVAALDALRAADSVICPDMGVCPAGIKQVSEKVSKAILLLRDDGLGDIEYVVVPREVEDLYKFMAMAFAPFTSQQEQIAISLQKAKRAMAANPHKQTP